jgi:hypothetical protein
VLKVVTADADDAHIKEHMAPSIAAAANLRMTDFPRKKTAFSILLLLEERDKRMRSYSRRILNPCDCQS